MTTPAEPTAETDRAGRRPDADPWIGIDAAAAHLGIPVRTLYRLAQRGKVPAAKVGRTWRFRASLLDAHLAAKGAGPAVAERTTVPVERVERSDPIRMLTELADLALSLAERRDPTDIADLLARGLTRTFGVDLAGLVQRDGEMVRTVVGHADRDRPVGPVTRDHRAVTDGERRFPLRAHEGLRRVIEDGAVLVLDDAGRVSGPAASIVAALGIHSALVVPIPERDAIWGALGIASRTPRTFTAFEIERLSGVAAQVGLALTNGRLLADAHRWSEHLEGIEALSRELNRSRGVAEVGEAVARGIDAVIDWDGVRFYVLQPDGETLEATTLRARVPYYADETPEMVRLRLGEGLGGTLAAARRAEVVGNVLHHPRMQDIPGTDAVDESMIVVPLVFEEHVLGVLEVSRLGLDMFDAEDLRLLQIIGAQAAVALANAHQVEELERRARTDPLTGLANRAYFTERVDQALARRARVGDSIAVLFVDLDGFKLINDSLGHAAGDALLASVAERFRRTVRGADTIARLGGDEFGVLLEDVTDPGQPIVAAERIGETLRAPLRLATRLVPIRASIGVVIDAGEARSADELLRNADVAMYRAKAAGRGSYAVFEPSMQAAQLARLELEGELRIAIERGEFALRFQPVVDLRTGDLASVEALLRWQHPHRGTISPLDFIPLAEETGQIVPIGAWVLRDACRQLARWDRGGIVGPDVRISVNLSARQLLDDAFLDEVDAALAETGLSPERLVLEVTESVMLVDGSSAVAVLDRLRSQGVHIALDDFGTGYSSLGYLRSLPADGIKLDRTFTDGLGVERERTAIVEAAIAFAHALDLSVAAEGIETDDQLDHLRRLDCDLGQGFRFAAPLPARDLEALLRTRTTFLPSPAARTVA
jgi:diguanylate cyclase (GGDEF)-like protein/excisionase family DNA binding protein